MKTRLHSTAAGAAMLFGLSLLAAGGASAQVTTAGFKGQPILEAAVSGDDGRQAVVAMMEFAPGGTNSRHTHLGDCYATVVEGAIELRIEGQAPRSVAAGQAYHVPRGLVHEMQNVGQVPARMVVTFVTDKGKPVRLPAP